MRLSKLTNKKPVLTSFRSILKVVVVLLPLLSCKEEEAIQVCDANVDQLYKKASFYCGVAVDPYELENNDPYARIVQRQFNSITAENIMKPYKLHPTPNGFSFFESDQLLEYCESKEKRLHGHTLIWHNQLPDWMNTFQGTKVEWDSIMKTHIQTIVSHYKGRVRSWDVVNEAFNDNGSLRQTIWLNNIGPDYIEKAFYYAHEADPEAVLFYNDYNIAWSIIKRDAVLNHLKTLKEKGVPVHGIGFQMHIANSLASVNQITSSINKAVEADLVVHISELDISINLKGEVMPEASKDDLSEQADKYLGIFKAYAEIPANYRTG